jgi:hypothetical protein
MLGINLGEIASLGGEARKAMSALPLADEERVASSVHELLVGAAFVRRGRDVEMLAENRATKVPDFAVHRMGVPIAIEYKRRLGLTTYEITEARHIESLYAAIRPVLAERGLHISLEAVFVERVTAVSQTAFVEAVTDLIGRPDIDGAHAQTAWGSISCTVLPYIVEQSDTRLYAPDFLEKTFGWSPLQSLWDGLLCEVDPPSQLVVSSARNPRCLKWVSLSTEALLKKSRSVTSLWRDTAKQFRAGEM